MSVVAIPRRRFDWPAFSTAITTFAVTHGLDGDCEVEAVVEAGLVEVPMLRFIETFCKRVGNAVVI